MLIPTANVKHLMLRRDVVEAVEQSQFHIYPVEHADQALSLLTGIEAGERGDDGRYPQDSLNRRISDRLVELAERRRSFSNHGNKAGAAQAGNGDGSESSS